VFCGTAVVLADLECLPWYEVGRWLLAGGAVFGSGTQGLQSRTRSPPPRLATSKLPAVSVLRGG
jgi:hypothetical protein